MKKHKGSCHCGAVTFSFNYGEIERGLRCNCSICRRKGTVMSEFTLSPDEINIESEGDKLSLYQFDTKIAKHYFCNSCGIYTFHETMRKPGYYRINLGCLDDIDTNLIKVEIFDGKNL